MSQVKKLFWSCINDRDLVLSDQRLIQGNNPIYSVCWRNEIHVHAIFVFGFLDLLIERGIKVFTKELATTKFLVSCYLVPEVFALEEICLSLLVLPFWKRTVHNMHIWTAHDCKYPIRSACCQKVLIIVDDDEIVLMDSAKIHELLEAKWVVDVQLLQVEEDCARDSSTLCMLLNSQVLSRTYRREIQACV